MSKPQSIEELQRRAEEVSREITQIRETIKKLKEKKITLISEIGRLREERSRLLDEIRSIRRNIFILREERGKLIDEYRKTISERRDEISQMKALRDLINTKSAKIQDLSAEIKMPLNAIRQKIDEIEWTIQTSILTQEQEKELVDKLRGYVKLLNKAQVIRKGKEEILELRALYISSKTKIRELTDRASKLRETIVSKKEEITGLRQKLNDILSRYMTIKKELESKKNELNQCNSELVSLTSRLSSLRENYQVLLKEIEKARSTEVLRQKKTEVLREVEQRSKKRLSLDEFKIIYGEVEDLEGD